jgi:hypothetical protein
MVKLWRKKRFNNYLWFYNQQQYFQQCNSVHSLAKNLRFIGSLGACCAAWRIYLAEPAGGLPNKYKTTACGTPVVALFCQ